MWHYPEPLDFAATWTWTQVARHRQRKLRQRATDAAGYDTATRRDPGSFRKTLNPSIGQHRPFTLHTLAANSAAAPSRALKIQSPYGTLHYLPNYLPRTEGGNS